MSDLKVTGGAKLSGKVTPSGNKNAALPMLCASLLTDSEVTLSNVPDIIDVNKIVELLGQLGSAVDWNKDAKEIRIRNNDISLDKFEGNLPLGMRASLLLISPLLQRFKKLTIDTNIGGCTLGMREIDPHIRLLEEMGVRVEGSQAAGRLEMSIGDGFRGGNLWPDYASVTATENVIMAAALANGTTTLYNAAAEPHVQDLCNMLNSMGANIEGIGSNRLIIHGVERLEGTSAKVSSDHHEIVTFLALAAMTGGRVEVTDAIPEHFAQINHTFHKLGVDIKYTQDPGTGRNDVAVVEEDQTFAPEVPFTENLLPRIEAAPWPYFPVDLLPLMIALSLRTRGITRFWNKVYEGGLFWVSELAKMGAKIEISDPHRILVIGPTDLKGATIECPYIIRSTVALMMAAMAAEGQSYLKNIDTIHRAHPGFLEHLTSLGAQIEVVE